VLRKLFKSQIIIKKMGKLRELLGVANQKNLLKVPYPSLKNEVCSELFSNGKFLGSSKRLHSSPFLKMESSGFDDNIADSFVSVTNRDFLKTLEFLQLEKTKLFEMDLLKETIAPGDIMGNTGQEAVVRYKIMFLSEIGKLKIELKDIERVLIMLTYKPGKAFVKYYTCIVTIRAKGKEYTRKVISSYS
jgi:hypothetical protein